MLLNSSESYHQFIYSYYLLKSGEDRSGSGVVRCYHNNILRKVCYSNNWILAVCLSGGAFNRGNNTLPPNTPQCGNIRTSPNTIVYSHTNISHSNITTPEYHYSQEYHPSFRGDTLTERYLSFTVSPGLASLNHNGAVFTQ